MARNEPSRSGTICVGVDVGGTFTDVVFTDGADMWRAKASTTPGDLGQGVLAACSLAASRNGKTLEEILPTVSRFGLGTTAVTNVLATRNGPRIGLITTKGFEDEIPLAKGRRLVEEGWTTMPPGILSRRQIVGVSERVDCDGQVLVPVDRNEVVAAARRLVEKRDVQALAVSFLWSFKNAVNEEAAVGAIREELPGTVVFSGAALNPIMREFERTTFALLNAYVGGAFVGIDALAEQLARLGLRVPLLLVHSGGGSITIDQARRVPFGLAESGPAAGVLASMSLAQASELSDVIACDMGGTSFDVSVISGGHPTRRRRGEVMGIWTSLPLIDVQSIGAGGGSIGWVDARGMLRVGPVSAGAVPGPACYARGGTEPTVTDALVVLGYIDPALFLGGEMALDLDAANRSCEKLGRQLGLDIGETAWGIRQLALEGMTKPVRSLLNARGLDPRDHAIVSYGGCGALFTCEIARIIGSTQVLVPDQASVLSAFGAATADIRRERVSALSLPMPVAAEPLQVLAEKLQADVLDDLAADGVAERDRSVEFEAELRFKRQVWELSVSLPTGRITSDTLNWLMDEFRAEYARRYGQGSIVLGAPIELVTLRAIGVGRTIRASIDAGGRPAVADGTPAPRAASRKVRIERSDLGTRPVDAYDGPALRPGHRIKGPALVDGVDTTIWIPPKMGGRMDKRSTLIVEAIS